MSLWTMTDEEAGKPKYLSDTLRNGQSVSDLDATFGVAGTEEAVTANKAKGIQHPGWVTVRTYTDAQGNTRYKSETLVASGSMTGDASDDSTVADLAITISTMTSPIAAGVGDQVSLSPTISINSALPLSYQWQKAESGAPTVFADIAGATDVQYQTAALTLAENGDVFRVVVSATGITATSNEVTVTVA